MTRRSALSSAANAAAVALVLAAGARAGAAVSTINTNDLALSTEAGTAPSLFLIKSSTTFEDTNQVPAYIAQPGWSSQAEIDGISFDNLSNGAVNVINNASGNLLGVYFGNTTNGGAIYSFSTDSSGNAPELIFGAGTLPASGGGGAGSTAFTSRGLIGTTELGGDPAVSPKNDLIALDTYNGQITDVIQYNASPTHNAVGASIGAGTTNAGYGTLDATATSGTIDPVFLDESGSGTTLAAHLLSLDPVGDKLYLTTITDPNTSAPYVVSSGAQVGTLPTFNGNGSLSSYTGAVIYNPQISPYIYALQADFVSATGADETTLGIFTFTAGGGSVSPSGFAEVGSFNLSSNNAALGTLEVGQTGARNLSMDSRGDLFYTVYSGGSLASAGESVYEIKNLGFSSTGWGNGSLGGNATLGYTSTYSGELETSPALEAASFASSSFLMHFDVPTVTGSSFSATAIGEGIPLQPPTPLLWSGVSGGTMANNTSGTWDTGITSNWVNSVPASTTWAENDAAEFGAGPGGGPVTVTIPSGVTHTVSVMTMFPGSPAYTITGGTVSLVGDNLGDGIADNIASFTIASNLQLGVQGQGAAPITVASGGVLAITGAVYGGTLTLTAGDGTTTYTAPDGTLSVNGTGTLLLTNTGNVQPGTNIGANTLVLSPTSGTFAVLGQSYTLVAAGAGVGTHMTPAISYGNLFDGGGTIIIAASGTMTQGLGFSGNGTVSVGSNTLTVTGPFQGSGGFTEIGAGSSGGTIVLAGLDNAGTGTASGPIEVAGGTLVDGAGTLIASTTGGNPLGLTALGNPSVNLGGPLGAGTLVLTPVGEATLTTATVQGAITGLMNIHLDNGGALEATGAGSQELRDGAYVQPIRQLSSSPSQTYISTPLSTDTLTLADEVEQYSVYGGYLNFVGPSYATINKIGAGRLILTSGGYTSDEDFNGQWNVSGGQLQIGPAQSSVSTSYSTGVIPSGVLLTSTSGPYLGGYGEPLNALGYGNQSTAPVGTYGAYGDPDQPSSITVSTGGMLALAVDSPNGNPNNTTVPLNPTPNYLRASVTLAGGSLASTGSEVVSSANQFPTDPSTGTVTTTQAYSYNMPDGVPVSAEVGGTFTVASVGSLTSTILVCDPNGTISGGDTGARNFSLVGGAAEYQVAVGPTDPGTTLSYATNWDGNLTISPGSLLTGVGTHAGGVFTIDRTYSFLDVSGNDGGGTVNVGTTGLVNVGTGTQAASITVNSGAGLVLNGIGVLSTGAFGDTGTASYDNNVITTLPALSAGAHSVAIVNNSTTSGNSTTGGVTTIPTSSGSGSFGFTVDGGTQVVGAITGTGDTGVAGGATLVMSSIKQGALQVDGDAVILSGGGTANSGSLSSLSIGSTSLLDIGDHSMVIEYGNGATPVGDLSFAHTARNYPANSLQRYAQTAYAGGNWTGPGITSSEAINDGNGNLAIGVADENDIYSVYPNDNSVADGGTGSWQGLAINDPNNVLVRMTYYGDGNDDGVVNKLDVTALSQGYSGLAGYVGWSDGDYNYDGQINKNDVSLLAASYEFQGAPLGNAISAGQAQYLLALDPDMPASTNAFFQAIADGQTPEPASIALLGAASVGLLARRRRRH